MLTSKNIFVVFKIFFGGNNSKLRLLKVNILGGTLVCLDHSSRSQEEVEVDGCLELQAFLYALENLSRNVQESSKCDVGEYPIAFKNNLHVRKCSK